MKKTLTTASLAAAFLLTLSGCSLTLGATDSGPATTAPPASPGQSAEGGAAGDGDARDDASGGDALSDSAECAAGESIVLATDNVVVDFTGPCGEVTISGDSVTATFEQTGSLSITGAFAAIEIAGSAQAVEVLGESNTVIVQELSSLAVGGSSNTVSWQAGAAEGVDTGAGNTLLGPAQ